MTDKDLIEMLLKKKKITKKELARKLNYKYPTFSRKFGLKRDLSFTTKECFEILNKLGYRVVITPKGSARKGAMTINFEGGKDND